MIRTYDLDPFFDGEVVYDSATNSVATIELEEIPVALVKHSSQIERSGSNSSVGMRTEQAAPSLVAPVS